VNEQVFHSENPHRKVGVFCCSDFCWLLLVLFVILSGKRAYDTYFIMVGEIPDKNEHQARCDGCCG